MERKRAFVTGAKYLGLSCVLLFLGCDSTVKQPASTRAADEAAVRQTDENWSKAAQSKKVDDWVAFYSDDAVILPPNDKKASSKEEVREYPVGTARPCAQLGARQGGSRAVRRLCVHARQLSADNYRSKRQILDRPRQNAGDLEETSRRHLEMCRRHVELRSSRHTAVKRPITA